MQHCRVGSLHGRQAAATSFSAAFGVLLGVQERHESAVWLDGRMTQQVERVRRSPLQPYLDVFRVSGAWQFSVAGLVGRMPWAMFGLGTVLLISGVTGRYVSEQPVKLALIAAAIGAAVAAIVMVARSRRDRYYY